MPELTPTHVYQDDFRPGKGNALQACIASIFNLTLQEVPNFIESPDGYESSIRLFCQSRGVTMEKVVLNEKYKIPDKYNGSYCILRGNSPRGDHGHVVVAQYSNGAVSGFNFVHDPHPDETYLLADSSYGWAMFFF